MTTAHLPSEAMRRGTSVCVRPAATGVSRSGGVRERTPRRLASGKPPSGAAPDLASRSVTVTRSSGKSRGRRTSTTS